MIIFLLFSRNIGFVEITLLALILLFQVIIIAQYWFYAHAKDNRLYLLSRYYEIDTDRIVETMEDGTSSTIKTERFIKMMKPPDTICCMLPETNISTCLFVLLKACLIGIGLKKRL